MSTQLLIKKTPTGGYLNIFPKSHTDVILDKLSGMALNEILLSFNCYFLSYNGSVESTRKKVPMFLRKEGLWITYVLYDHTVITEWYNDTNIDDDSWSNSSNWRKGSNVLVGDLSISSNGKWVIDGVETEFYARGEQGITPILRIYNNKLQVSYNEGETWEYVTDNPIYTLFRVSDNKLQVSTDLGKNWSDTSDYIAAWFRWGSNNKIQISRTNSGGDWQDLSGSFVDKVRIKKYIGINEELPISGVEEGTIYMKGPYYDVTDSNNDNPIYRMWVYSWKGDTLAWQDNGEFTSIAAGIVQETGDNENVVMSQKATSKALIDLENETSLIASDTLSIIDIKINENYKRQAVSGFITAPFRIEINTGYKIRRDTRYDKNFNEIDYTDLNVTAYYSDDNTAYHRLYFAADDERYLSEDDIDNIIKEFTGSKDRTKIIVTQENGVLTIKSGQKTDAEITITNDVSIAHDLKKAASSRALAIYKEDNNASLKNTKVDIKNLSISVGELVPYQEFAPTGLSTPIEIVSGKYVGIGDNLNVIINAQEESGAYYYVKFIYNDLTEENYGKLTAASSVNYNIDIHIAKELSKILLYSNVPAAIAIRKEHAPTILDNRLSIVEEDTKNIKRCGILLGRTILTTNGRTNALTVANIEDLIDQKTIYYKIDNVENPIGKYAFIEVFKVDGSKQVYGKGSGSDSQTLYTGEIPITDDITKITYNSDTSADVLIYTNISNTVLNDKVNVLNDKVNAIESGNSVKEIKTPVFGYSTLGDGKYDILSTADEDATEYDNKLMVYPWILKVNENLYYLYYNALGKTEEYTITEEGKTYIGGGQHLCIAYSTNGTEYHRGVPEGASTPIPGTHKLFERGVRSASVVKVFDVEYPYRMICADMGESKLQMYKSKDAVNFTFVKDLTVQDGHYDSSTSSIVRGNLIKIYARGWSPTTEKPCRIIRTLTVTIDGDLVCPATVAIDEEQLYTAGASPLDDRRDILFPCWYNDPTYYAGGDDTLTMKCIIVDGSRYENISIFTHNVQSSSDLQIYAANLVSIPCNRPQENPDPYNRYWDSDQRHLLVHVSNITHNHFDDPNRIDKIRLCRMSFAEYNG